VVSHCDIDCLSLMASDIEHPFLNIWHVYAFVGHLHLLTWIPAGHSTKSF
jgi:hypothetical protein